MPQDDAIVIKVEMFGERNLEIYADIDNVNSAVGAFNDYLQKMLADNDKYIGISCRIIDLEKPF